MDSNRYLSTQLSRAICKSTYEEPQTIEEISVRTGIPAMYIEDEIPRLEYGDALCKIGKKYAANFIYYLSAARSKNDRGRFRVYGKKDCKPI